MSSTRVIDLDDAAEMAEFESTAPTSPVSPSSTVDADNFTPQPLPLPLPMPDEDSLKLPPIILTCPSSEEPMSPTEPSPVKRQPSLLLQRAPDSVKVAVHNHRHLPDAVLSKVEKLVVMEVFDGGQNHYHEMSRVDISSYVKQVITSSDLKHQRKRVYRNALRSRDIRQLDFNCKF